MYNSFVQPCIWLINMYVHSVKYTVKEKWTILWKLYWQSGHVQSVYFNGKISVSSRKNGKISETYGNLSLKNGYCTDVPIASTISIKMTFFFRCILRVKSVKHVTQFKIFLQQFLLVNECCWKFLYSLYMIYRIYTH